MGRPARSHRWRGVAFTLRTLERSLRAPAADGRGAADRRRYSPPIPGLRLLWPLALLWVLEAAAFAAATPAEEALVVEIAGADRRRRLSATTLRQPAWAPSWVRCSAAGFMTPIPPPGRSACECADAGVRARADPTADPAAAAPTARLLACKMAMNESNLLPALLRGFILGLAIAAPVGPIGVLCIRRTLAMGRLFGFVSGLGVATADALYGCVAAFGLTAISGLLVRQQDLLRLLGGLFLCYLGVRTYWPDPPTTPPRPKVRARRRLLLNPAADPHQPHHNPLIRRGLRRPGVGGGNGYGAAAAIVLGVFLGSAAWWFLLSGGVSLVRNKFDARAMLWVNRISGVIILGFGAAALSGLGR